jgi:hypothetical protein
LERETGIEPATNSLEGCDSTTELLPPSRRSLRLSPLRRGRPDARRTLELRSPVPTLLRPSTSQSRRAQHTRAAPPTFSDRRANLHMRGGAEEGWWGGEGSNLRSPKAAGLQPAAIDRSATSPKYITRTRSGHDLSGSQRLYPLRPWAVALKPAYVMESACPMKSLKGGVIVHGAGGGI